MTLDGDSVVSGRSRPTRVLINALYYRPGIGGGAETYVIRLLSELQRTGGVEITVLAMGEAVDDIASRTGAKVIRASNHSFSQPLSLVLQQFSPHRAFRASPFDLVHVLGGFLTPGLGIPQILTVHDLLHRELAGSLPPAKWLFRESQFRWNLLQARGVVAISEYTARSLASTYGYPRERTSIVHHGSELPIGSPPFVLESDKGRHGIDGSYFYYPASFTPHKQHAFLLRAFARYRKIARVPLARLVLSGKGTDGPQLTDLLADLGLSEAVRPLGYLHEKDVLSLMSSATAMVYPSAYEGFGLPIVEAMQLGTPVLASSSASIPEVIGGAGLTVASDESSWADAMDRIARDTDLQRRLSALGLTRAAAFTWRRCAAETVAAYQRFAQ